MRSLRSIAGVLIAVIVLLALTSLWKFRKTDLSLTTPPVPSPVLKLTESQEELPSDFPLLPVYPQAVVKNALKSEEDDLIVYSAKWEVKAPQKTVQDWYRDQLEAAGWNLVNPQEFDYGPEPSIEFEKNGLVFNLVLEMEEDGELDIYAQFPLQHKSLYENN